MRRWTAEVVADGVDPHAADHVATGGWNDGQPHRRHRRADATSVVLIGRTDRMARRPGATSATVLAAEPRWRSSVVQSGSPVSDAGAGLTMPGERAADERRGRDRDRATRRGALGRRRLATVAGL